MKLFLIRRTKSRGQEARHVTRGQIDKFRLIETKNKDQLININLLILKIKFQR